ncbi:phage terminase large subunit [Caenispirillum bisanense]|uniref:Phage uncharacterized protein (Putative large terminase), C-terminal domain-containing protein n=1 Tax=Caenispirillum bisanense TaxID=414052 RepID=A0A286GYS2_9PROT|nr:phage terminase large subunit [Caenispirillum bisanense]SOE00657.1 phage uncharacterized protein (putative large terminase), C-terminal domain-containing protein [Caenispirillum bisanense]
MKAGGIPRWKRKGRFGTEEFLEEARLLAQSLRDQIAQADVLGDDFPADAASIAARRRRAGDDFGYFCRTYFPHRGRAEYSTFHRWIFARCHEITEAGGGARDAVAAPRGNAKSTYLTELFPLWCILTRRRRYPVILSDAIEVAAMMLEGIKTELTDNPRLAVDFPAETGQGAVWQVGVIVTRTGCKVQCGGARKRLRGFRHGAQRPDLVILDDLENDENVRSPEQRQKLDDWINKTVEPLGPPDGSMDIVYVGTVLHLDSVLARKLKDPTWQSTRFQAIIRWPDRMDLWEQWEEVYRNTEAGGAAAAEEFYLANRDEMERGAEVLWPAVQTLKRLMLIRMRVGTSAFNSEYQNNPLATDATFTAVTYWVQLQPRLVYFGALDPSLGKNNKSRSDPSALLIGAFDRQAPRLDVVEASIRRRPPNVIIADAIALQRQYRCVLWFVESVQFQDFLRTELMAAAARAGINMPCRAVLNSTDKDLRIESLQPPIDAGMIRFHPSQTTLLAQLQGWPQADHDDGPDALEMLWAGAVASAALVDGGGIVVGGRRASATLEPTRAAPAQMHGAGFATAPSSLNLRDY